MNVGITTTSNVSNYGAMLQTYALNRVVREMGHDCRTIDYVGEPMVGRGLSFCYRWPLVRLQLIMAARWAENRRWRRRFLEFKRRHIPLTRPYASIDELRADPPRLDACLTGSDQVWHPLLLERTIGRFYHLDFADPARTRLIAYAPSFGVSQFPENRAGELRAYLQRYHALSAREVEGCRIVAGMTGRDVAHVLDPTLLLAPEQYDAVATPPRIQGPYILVYPMDPGVVDACSRLVAEVQRQFRLPLVYVFQSYFDHTWLDLPGRMELSAGPAEFLGLVRNAAFVCTNSFHATALSVLFNRRFLTVPHSKYNSRILGLLSTLGLDERQLAEVDATTVARALAQPVDWDAVAVRLQARVRQSRRYLEDALRA